MKGIKTVLKILVLAALVTGGIFAYRAVSEYIQENKVLRQVISRLEADTRIAQVLVTAVEYDEGSGKNYTTIKFLEYDSQGNPLTPKYFTFSGNIIQFQSLVIRFEDDLVRSGDALKGKSAYLFWKVFMLDGANTQEYEITKVDEVPSGYRIGDEEAFIEQKLWQRFWDYALDGTKAKKFGIKNAQIEAPGTMFVPGMIYTIKIEHDGGIRIDTAPVPEILKGERL